MRLSGLQVLIIEQVVFFDGETRYPMNPLNTLPLTKILTFFIVLTAHRIESFILCSNLTNGKRNAAHY